MRVLVHGGAGGEPDEPATRRAVLAEAASAGAEAASPIDAVEAAVRHLEAAPRFNAGRGSAVQVDGEIRTDAGVMSGDRRAGAACSMPGVRHAVSVARAVLEETPHVLVSGEGAVSLAAACGIETGRDLFTSETRERFAAAAPPAATADRLAWVRERFGREGHDTVGAVAADETGLAAATSTGGRWFALAGRVGDVPQIGSGFYASPAAAASATGAGEDIARTTLSRRAVRHVERGAEPAEAADLAISAFGELTGSRAGVIVVGRNGDTGRATNADAMQTASAPD